MQKEVLSPNTVWDSSRYNFSQAIRVRQPNEFLVIAGQSGINAQGKIVEGIEAQIRLSFENIRRIVTAAGGSMANIVKLNAYFLDIGALPLYTNILGEFFTDGFPAATVVEVQRLALPGLLFEVEATAVL
jgi:enamine deaminase RidA (YjgF/YER057c/UK114 family)